MKFAANTWIWTPDFAENNFEVLYKVEKLGFKGIELPTLDANADPQKLKEKLETTKLQPIILAAGTNKTDLTSEYLTVREAGVAYIRKCVVLAANIGAKLIGGPFYSPVGKLRYLNELDREREFKIVSELLKDAALFAKDQGIKLAIEPMNRYDTYFLNTVDDGLRLIEGIGVEENVGLLLDSFHMNIEETSPSEAIRKAGENLFHFHAAETNRGPPGTGSFGWKLAARALKSIKYEDWISIESFTNTEPNFATMVRMWKPPYSSPDDLARDGLRFMKRLLAT